MTQTTLEFCLSVFLVGMISILLFLIFMFFTITILNKFNKKTNNKYISNRALYLIVSASFIISIFVNVTFLLNDFVNDKKDLTFINNIVKKINNKNIDINNEMYSKNIFKIIDNKVYYSKDMYNQIKDNNREFYLYLIQFLPEDRKKELCLLIADSLKNDELLKYKFTEIVDYLKDSFEIISLSKEKFEEIINSNENNKKIIQDTIKEIKNECKNCIHLEQK